MKKGVAIVILTTLAIGTYLYFRKPKKIDAQDKIYQSNIKAILDKFNLYSGVAKQDHDTALLEEVNNGNLTELEYKKLITQTLNLDSALLYKYFMFLRTRYGYVNP